MYKALAGLFFGLYILIATGHGIWFVAEAKYQCIKQVGLSKGFFWGCDKFYVDPLNRMLNDSFFNNFYRGLVWPAHYWSGGTGKNEQPPKSLTDKAYELSDFWNRTFEETESIKSLVTRVELSSVNRFVFEIEWEPRQFKKFEELPVELFKSKWVANTCSQLAEDNREARLLNEIKRGGYNLRYIFSAKGIDEKLEVEIESCYPISYF